MDVTVTFRVVWTSLLHLELCGRHCYIKSCVDVTVTFRVVWTSLLLVHLWGCHCYIYGNVKGLFIFVTLSSCELIHK